MTTPTPDLTQFSSFIAGPDWVMFKDTDDGGGALVRDGQPALSLPAGFNRAGRLYPTTTGRMWLLDEEPTYGVRTAVELDVTGRQTSRTARRQPGRPVGQRVLAGLGERLKARLPRRAARVDLLIREKDRLRRGTIAEHGWL